MKNAVRGYLLLLFLLQLGGIGWMFCLTAMHLTPDNMETVLALVMTAFFTLLAATATYGCFCRQYGFCVIAAGLSFMYVGGVSLFIALVCLPVILCANLLAWSATWTFCALCSHAEVTKIADNLSWRVWNMFVVLLLAVSMTAAALWQFHIRRYLRCGFSHTYIWDAMKHDLYWRLLMLAIFIFLLMNVIGFLCSRSRAEYRALPGEKRPGWGAALMRGFSRVLAVVYIVMFAEIFLVLFHVFFFTLSMLC